MEPTGPDVTPARATGASTGTPASMTPVSAATLIEPAGVPGRRRLVLFRMLAALPVLLFLIAAVNLLAPWVFVLPVDEPHPASHRWFFAVAAAADVLGLVSFAGLILRPRLTALAATIAVTLSVVMVTIVPLQPDFFVLLGIVIAPAVLAYPYWRDLRAWRTWWSGARRPLLVFAVAVCLVLLFTSVVAMRRQVVNDDSVAAANWWNDYAEHAANIGLVGVLAISTAPGRLLIRGILSGVWLYLGAVAAFVLPDASGSWGRAGGVAAIMVGVVFGLAAWRGLRIPADPVTGRGQASA